MLFNNKKITRMYWKGKVIFKFMYGYGINILSAVTVLIIKFRAGENGYMNGDAANGVVDTRIKANSPTVCYTGYPTLRLSNWSSTINYVMLKFNGLAHSSGVVVSVYIDFYVFGTLPANGTYTDTVDVYEIINPDVSLKSCTWQNRWEGLIAGIPSTLPWGNNTHNGAVQGIDYASTPFLSTVLSGSMVGTHIQIPLPADIVQKWLTTPSNNCGILMKLRTVSATDQYIEFSSSDTVAPYESRRPQLVINYI